MNTKQCSNCNNFKDLTEYHKNKSSADGLYSVCKICKNDKNKLYKNINKESEIKRNQLWYLKNTENKKMYYKKYYFENKFRYHIARIKRISVIKQATLPGYNKEIDIIYKNRPNGYHVDHIVPLQGKTVCGLHVPWNLQVIKAEENLKKGNKLELQWQF